MSEPLDHITVLDEPHGGVSYLSMLYGRQHWKATLVCKNGEITEFHFKSYASGDRFKLAATAVGVTSLHYRDRDFISETVSAFPQGLMEKGKPVRSGWVLHDIPKHFGL